MGARVNLVRVPQTPAPIALLHQAHKVISVASLMKMAEAQVVERAKAQQNYCQKIKLPRKSRSIDWKNNKA